MTAPDVSLTSNFCEALPRMFRACHEGGLLIDHKPLVCGRGRGRAPGSVMSSANSLVDPNTCAARRAWTGSPARAADPVHQRRAVDIEPVTGKDLGLTIERDVVAILADQQMGQQRGARQSLAMALAPGGSCRRRGSHIWGGEYAQACRHEAGHLADGLADGIQRAMQQGQTAPSMQLDILAA
jgi:hypothetical protein